MGFLKKLIKKGTILISSLILLMNIGVPTLASTITEDKLVDKTRNEFFPHIEEKIKNENLELVGTYETFFKVEPINKISVKTKYEKNEVTFTPISKEEFYQNKKDYIEKDNSKQLRQFGDEFGDEIYGNNGDSNLRLYLQVFRKPFDKSKFEVYNNYEWIGNHFVSLTDIIGINVGNNMRVDAESYQAQFAHYINGGQTIDTATASDFVHQPNGVAVKFDLHHNTLEFGYIKADVSFLNPDAPGTQLSNIIGNYTHTKVGFNGSLSLTPGGLPSVGFNFLDKLYTCPVNVGYKN